MCKRVYYCSGIFVRVFDTARIGGGGKFLASDIEIISHRIGGSKVTEEEFYAFVDKINDHIRENEVVWYNYTESELAKFPDSYAPE